MYGYVCIRVGHVRLELQIMSDVGETLIDYALKKDLEEAEKDGMFEDCGIPGENEDRHCSELARRLNAFDSKEIYIAVKTLATNHWEMFSKSILYLERKGRNGTD